VPETDPPAQALEFRTCFPGLPGSFFQVVQVCLLCLPVAMAVLDFLTQGQQIEMQARLRRQGQGTSNELQGLPVGVKGEGSARSLVITTSRPSRVAAHLVMIGQLAGPLVHLAGIEVFQHPGCAQVAVPKFDGRDGGIEGRLDQAVSQDIVERAAAFHVADEAAVEESAQGVEGLGLVPATHLAHDFGVKGQATDGCHFGIGPGQAGQPFHPPRDGRLHPAGQGARLALSRLAPVLQE
jgi:hypothetical protein